MKIRYRSIIAVLVVVLFGAQLVYMAWKEQPEEEEFTVEAPVLIWYTDPAVQTYMEAAAAEVASRYQVEVRAELVSEVDYIENICESSVAEVMSGPDVYVVSSSLLEKATLAGLTVPLTDTGMAETYSEKAVQAVTYDGKAVARPFYIETCFMLYNRYYVNEEDVPDTIDEILTYAENFETDEMTEKVESIFKWNVADVIDDYMFLGAYMDLGGPNGDDKSQVSLDLEHAAECMDYYQSLNGFFAIDADTVTSEEVIRDFIDGKTVFTLVNVPMLAELDRAVQSGELPEYATERTVTNEAGEEVTEAVSYEPFYQVETLPALTDTLSTRGLSVTTAVAVNPYTSNLKAANACARYLTEGRSGLLYEETGKLSACRASAQEISEEHQAVYEAYEQAAEVPKIMELSNMWLQLEVTLADIWRGEDARESLAGFEELLQTQLD